MAWNSRPCDEQMGYEWVRVCFPGLSLHALRGPQIPRGDRLSRSGRTPTSLASLPKATKSLPCASSPRKPQMHGAATKTEKRRPWPPELWLRAVGRPVGTTLSCALEQITAARQPQRCWAFDVPPRPGQVSSPKNTSCSPRANFWPRSCAYPRRVVMHRCLHPACRSGLSLTSSAG